MGRNSNTKGPIYLVKSAVNTLVANPIVLYPYFILAFIQVLILELIYFAPRYPLSTIFAPIIVKTAGPLFLHYPFNYTLLGRWFGSLGPGIYILVSCIFYAASVLIIAHINSGKQINLKKIFRQVYKSYLHLAATMLLSVLVLEGMSFLHGLIIKRAIMIKSTTGVFLVIKKIVLVSAPYVELLFACVVTALFAFMVPLIILEGKKFFSALRLNFQRYAGSFWLISCIALLTAVLYLPIILMKSSNFMEWSVAFPEMYGFLLASGIVVMLFTDALLYTAITTQYLLTKEE